MKRLIACVVALSVVSVGACVMPQQRNQIWVDVTGAGRGDTDLHADMAPCEYERQRVANDALARSNSEHQGGSSPGLGAMQGWLDGENAGRAGNAAFAACMSRKGWVLQ